MIMQSKQNARRRRLCVVESHPIQYKAPLFRYLHERADFDIKVFYAMIPDQSQQGDGFGVSFTWDVPLLEGYPFEVLNNRSKSPSVTAFGGCDTPDIYAKLKSEAPDAVLVNGWVVKTCLQALWACKRLNIPCMVRGEANLLRPRAWWKHVIHRQLLAHYSAYLYIGSANRDFYRSHGCRESRLFFAPYAVDNDRFFAAASERSGRRNEIRDAFGIPRTACVFLFAGKLEEKKRPMDVMRAIGRLTRDLRERAHVLIAGDGPLGDEIRAFARDNAIPATFAGFVNQSRLPDAYAASNALVLASSAGETWGLVVNEAMASGLPAIVSRSAGCCTDLVSDDVTGFAFDEGDVDALVACLRSYIADPDLAARHGAAAREKIGEYGFEQIRDGVARAMQAVNATA